MGGCYQHKKFSNKRELLRFISKQITCANEMGLYLLRAEIKQVGGVDGEFEFFAYFSK